jgi:hypothetical protein
MDGAAYDGATPPSALRARAAALRDLADALCARADAGGLLPAPVTSLPSAVACMIFSALPLDARAAAALVCPAWRAFLATPPMLADLDVSPDSGVARRGCEDSVSTAFFEGALSRRAAGHLQTLNISGCPLFHAIDTNRDDDGRWFPSGVYVEELQRCVRDNAHTLRELRASAAAPHTRGYLSASSIFSILESTPQLRLLEADAECKERPGGLVTNSGDSLGPVGEAFCLLHKRRLHDPAGLAPCYDALRVRRLRVDTDHLPQMGSGGWGWNNGTDRSNYEYLGAVIAEHDSLTGLELIDAVQLQNVASFSALAQGLVRSNILRELTLSGCSLDHTSLPTLTRLLRECHALVELSIMTRGYVVMNRGALLGDDVVPADAQHVTAFCAALAASKLTRLALTDVRLFDSDASCYAAAELCGAVAGHPTLQELALSKNREVLNDGASTVDVAVGAALGTLVAANSPSLRTLDLGLCGLRDDELGPLFDALPANTHLETLHCCRSNISEAFARERMLPAVRANVSLRHLNAAESHYTGSEYESVLEAQQLVAQR